jgi:eukaryotic-like serine/threonine-protein kinase
MRALSPESRANLLSTLRAKLSERWQLGDLVRIEHYLSQHPELADDSEALIGLVYSEVLLRLERGETPVLGEYLARFPIHAQVLRLHWSQFRLVHPELGTDGKEGQGTVSADSTGEVAGRASPLRALPGFELYETLGEGGMGVVYKARDLRLDQLRAIKVIRTGPFAGSMARQRFITEAKAVARLNHAGVVRIFSLGEHEDVLFICMEFVEGGSLQERLRQGPLAGREAAELLRQLALAVQHAHDAGVLHRDLKPGNVLLDAEGTPKVSDFGLAKLLDTDDGLTYTGAVMGTPSYMAPEQALGSKSIGPPADVFALGAILYECLTGKHAFKAGTRSGTLARVKDQPPVPPRALRPEVPPVLEAICLKCLEKPSQQRYASAGALAEDLQNWLDGKPTHVKPAGGFRRVWDGLWRWRRPVLAVASVLLLAGLAAGLLWYFGYSDHNLWPIEAQLKEGKAADLIRATGEPQRWCWWLGGDKATTGVERDGTFAVHGWPLTLVELLPRIDRSHYVIHAQVRHLKSNEYGTVGLYFAGTTHWNTAVPVRSFLCVTFNDLQDVRNKAPPAMRQLLGPSKGNPVEVKSRHYAESKDKVLLDPEHTLFDRELFKIAGNALQPGIWRTLRIEVSPSRARIFWEDNVLVGEVTFANVDGKMEMILEPMRQLEPSHPALTGLSIQTDSRGAMGLVLSASSASFRNVRVEPVPDADDPQ